MNQLRGVHQQPGAGHFVQIVFAQGAKSAAQFDQLLGGGGIASGFAHDDGPFPLGAGKIEAQSDETLASGGFQALEQILVAGVVGDHQHERRRRRQNFASPFDGQHPPVVGQWMQHHRGVLARLHHFIEVANAAFAHRSGQRPVAPDGGAAVQQMPPHQIGGRQIVVASDRVQRQLQPRRHVGDEAGLAATGRSLDQQRQAVAPSRFEHGALITGRLVVRGFQCVRFDRRFHGHLSLPGMGERLRCLGAQVAAGWAVPTSTVCGLSLAKKL